MSNTRLCEPFYLALLLLLAGDQAQAQALNPVPPPDFFLPSVGYYSSYIWPTAGWNLFWSNPGDVNFNPGAAASGAVMKRTGMYSVIYTNIVEAWCDPNYYWIEHGQGLQPLGWIMHDASTTKTDGNCFFNVTIGSALRQPIQGAPPPSPPQTTGYPLQPSNTPYSFNFGAFVNNVTNAIKYGNPAPVGFELAVRDPKGNLVYSTASGSATGSSSLPPKAMTKDRRFDTASMSKTITATAVMAALDDLAGHKPPLGVTLDSSIVPYVPSNWDKSKIANVTFRSLLRHTSGFVIPPCGTDAYEDVETMVKNGPDSSKVGKWNYNDLNYALLRIVLPYLVDGPAAYEPFESTPSVNAELTAISYRSYVRNRIFDPIGLSGVDDFYTGPLPETAYFDAGKKAIPDNINIPGYNISCPPTGYDQTSNHMVLYAGSGNWTLSAEEYSQFISSLWLGKIVSPAIVTEMLPQNDQIALAVPLNTSVGIGMYGSILEHAGKTWWDYGENGGGGLGGPGGMWITFFNGYTAVLLSNSAAWDPGFDMAKIFGSALNTTVSPLLDSTGEMHVFAVGEDGRMYETFFNQGAWNGGGPVPGIVFSQGTTVSSLLDKSGLMHLFAVGEDGRVWTNSGQTWGGWGPVSTGVFSQGTTVSSLLDSSGLIHLFAVGEDGFVYTTWAEMAAWEKVSTGVFSQGTTVSSLLDSSGVIHLFAVGEDGRVWTTFSQPGGHWAGWASVSTGVFSQGTAVSSLLDRSGLMHLFAVGEDSFVSTTWAEMAAREKVSTGLFSQGTTVSSLLDSTGEMHLFAVGLDGRVYETFFNQGFQAWAGWEPVSTGVFSQGTAVSSLLDRSGLMHLFAREDGRVWTTFSQPGGPWAGWAPVSTRVF